MIKSILWFIISSDSLSQCQYLHCQTISKFFHINYCISPSTYSNLLHCHNVLAFIKYITFNLMYIQGTTWTIQCTETTPCTDASPPFFLSLQSQIKNIKWWVYFCHDVRHTSVLLYYTGYLWVCQVTGQNPLLIIQNKTFLRSTICILKTSASPLGIHKRAIPGHILPTGVVHGFNYLLYI